MALTLQITFSDPKRKDVHHPFSFQDVLRRAWWPLAQRLALPLLQQLECLNIREPAEAERLIRELEMVREALACPEAVGVAEGDAAYMLQRISEVEPLIRGAIQDWDDVVNNIALTPIKPGASIGKSDLMREDFSFRLRVL